MPQKPTIKRIHVNMLIIKANQKTGLRDPVCTVKTSKKNHIGHEVEILGPDGEVVAKLVYSPDKPLDCGARMWVETTAPVIVDGERII